MKKYSLLIALFFSVVGVSTAQIDYQLKSAIDFYYSQKVASGEYRKNELTEKDINGSPYLNDEFIKGSIYTVSKTQYADVPLRYNIYNDEIEFQTSDNKILALSTPEIVEKVVFGKYTMEYIPFEAGNKVKRGFFKLLLEGKVSLYARPEIHFEGPKPPAAYQEAQPAKFHPKDDRYYIRTGQEVAQSVGNKKELIGLFPDHKNEIEAFIKKNKINIKKPEELKSLVEYYNSL